MDPTLFIWLLIPAVLIISFIIINNGIIRRKNMVVRAWSDVITYERQKNKTLPELERVAGQYQEHEAKLLEEITALRSTLSLANTSDVDTSQLAQIEARTQSMLGSFNIAMEAYPNLEMAGVTKGLMKEISELQDNISAAISIFNGNVEAFNSGIQIFPNNLVNGMGAKQTPYKPFTNTEAAESIGFTLEQE
ncbi:LemA family protein [Kordiimonas sp. SCSIO 12603]|uniref:LemA family protein n=1 Tax=Kordiimonas sp. SCSIO 12603 TaxID=2829596 RepID=UPI00210621EC|nr:LemA family protein [Kordiimonas sp. SCSIO 12603]UTW59823.1 LemA family protein [Kordiimonas sp. SCSIO 12603]